MSHPFTFIMGAAFVAALLVAAWTARCIANGWNDPGQWRAIEAAVPAAVISAAVLGLVVGLSVYLVQSGRDEQARRNQDAQEAADQQQRVLSLITAEMRENIHTVDNMDKNMGDPLLQWMSGHPLSLSVWEALNQSGQTKGIDDLSLLAGISRANEVVSECKTEYGYFLDAFMGPTAAFVVPFNGKTMPAKQLILSRIVDCYGSVRFTLDAELKSLRLPSRR